MIPEDNLFTSGHNACAGCGAAISLRHIIKIVGNNVVVVLGTGCMEVVSTIYPNSTWKVPVIHSAFANTAATASGVYYSLKSQGRKEKVIAIAGDGGTFDIGLQALSGAFARRDKILYICYDNEAYMNCLSLDTYVNTEYGLKKITDLKVGERVYALDQKKSKLVLKKCTGIYDNGIKKVFEVTTLHHSIKATANHPFLTIKRNGRGKETNRIWKKLEQLDNGDEIIVLKKLNDGKSFAFKKIQKTNKGDYKVNKINEIHFPEKTSADLMEFFGLFIGDGWIRVKKGEIGFALPENTEGRRRIIEIFKSVFKGQKYSQDKNYVYFYSKNLATFIDSLEFGHGAKNKIIPSWIFTLPENEKEAFLNGLMLSDGYSFGKSMRYVSASLDLLKTLRLLLQTMNYRVGKIHQQKKKKGTFVVYRNLLEDSNYGYICFSKKADINLNYLSQIKQRDFFIDNQNFSTEKITSISFIKEEPTIDLRVEGEHNFIADGIVVHNTGIQKSGSTPRFAETTTTNIGTISSGNDTNKKDIPFIMASHGENIYVATASIGLYNDFEMKLKKAIEHLEIGPAYLQVLTPCIPGWKIPSDSSIDISKKAVLSRVYPLFEIENGVVNLQEFNQDVKIEDYLLSQGRFSHLNAGNFVEIKKNIEENFRRLKILSNNKVKVF